MARPSLLHRPIGPYQLLDFLGAGGMGAVYRAEDTRSNRIVAVKVLAGHDPGFLARFRNEAQIQARLRHENIAAFFDFLEHEGHPCIVMECVEGRTLYQHIQAEGPFPVGRALPLFRAVAEAVAYLHDHQIVHRDIKAGNIKLTPQGRVKLLDFGIARGPSSPGLTATGAVVGTPQYLSPEQLKGHRAGPEADVWALGVLLHEMLTGHVPFEADNLLDLYEKISRAVFVPPSVLNPEVTPRIEAIIGRCLKKKPADRYASCHALRKAVERAMHPGSRTFYLPALRARAAARNGWHRLRRALAHLPAGASRGAPRRERRPPQPPASPKPSVLPPAVQRGGLVGIGLLATALFLLLYLPGNLGDGAPSRSPLLHCTDDSTRQAGTHAVKLRVLSGSRHARIVAADGGAVGTTPCWIRGPAHTKASLVLQQDGYLDQTIYVDFHERRTEYAITMDQAGR